MGEEVQNILTPLYSVNIGPTSINSKHEMQEGPSAAVVTTLYKRLYVYYC